MTEDGLDGNGALAMISTFAKCEGQPGGGQLFLIHGQVYHVIGGLYPQPEVNPVYNQLPKGYERELRMFRKVRLKVYVEGLYDKCCCNGRVIYQGYCLSLRVVKRVLGMLRKVKLEV